MKNKIETNRITLRPFNQTDLSDFYEYASVPGVGEMAGWPHHKSIEISQKVLDSFMENNEVYAIWHKVDKKVIGSLGLHKRGWLTKDERYKHLNSVELGYVLSKAYWGQGIMVEAASAAINAAFESGIEIIACNHFLDNNQSRRVIEKLGFAYDSNGIFKSTLLEKDFEEKRYVLWKS